MNSARNTVVITGATSFVGMHLCDAFSKNNWRVIAGHSRNLADYSDIQSTRISHISNAVEFEKFDVCDKNSLSNIVDNYSPTLWIQHAGYATDHASADYNFESGLKINVGSIPPLFQALKNKDCGVIVTGTEAEYGSSDTAHAESDVANPNSLYGVTKLAQTITAQQQSNYYGVPTRVARLFLPFGTFDHPGKVVSLVINALKSNQPIDLSPCTQKRDFIGIKDVCSAYLKMADDLGRGRFDIFNVCSGNATELSALLKLIADNIGADLGLLNFGKIPLREGEPDLILGDSSKAFSDLAWQTRSLSQSVNEDLSL